MAKEKGEPKNGMGLRRKAEERLLATKQDVAAMPVKDVQQLMHELQVHQIELEMQNDELRRTQVGLEAARARYLNLYDFAPIALLMMDQQGTIVEANLWATTLLGVNRQRLIGQPLARFVASEDQDTFHRHCQEVLITGTGQTCELHLLNKPDISSWVKLESLVIHDELRPLTHWQTALLDITERKRAEETQLRFAAIVEGSDDAIIAKDLHGFIITWNQGAEQLFGYTAEEAIGRPISILFPPDRKDEGAHILGQIVRGEHIRQYEAIRQRKDGSLVYISSTVSPIKGAQGQVIGATKIARDITERKQAEAALRTSELRFRAIFNQTFQFIGLMKTDGTLIEANRSALQFAGIREEDVLGKSFWETPWWTHSVELQNRLREAVRQAAGGTMVRFEATHPSPTGELAHIDFSLKPVRDEHGNVILLIPEGRDITERKRAERALRESQEQFQAIMDNSPAMMFLKDVEGRYLLVNRTFEETLHLANGDIIGKTDEDIFPPEQAAAFRANDRKVLEAKEPVEFEELALHADGPHTSIVVKFPLVNPQGQCYALCGIVTDITDRKRAEEALRRHETGLMLAQELAHLGSWEWDIQTGAEQWSAEQYRIFGYAPNSITATYDLFKQVVHSEDRERVLAAVESAFNENAAYDVECRIVRPSGEERIVQCRGEVVRTATGQPVKMFGTVLDTTERKRVEEALTQSEERFGSFVRSTDDGIVTLDRLGLIRLWNPGAEKMFGYAQDEVLGKPMNLLMPERFRERHARGIEQASAAEGNMFELMGLRKDGTEFPTEISLSSWRTRHKVFFTGIVRDITKRKQVQAQLQETLTRLQNLSRRVDDVREEERTRIARELHDELGVRLTCLKMDLARVPSLVPRHRIEEKVRAMTAEVDSTIASVQRLVAELRPGILDDLGLVAAIEWQCQDFEQRSGIRCCCEARKGDIQLDRPQATVAFRIFQEALTNVARHAQATSIRVLVDQLNGDLLLEIHDDGLGIPIEKLTDSASLGLLGMHERAASLGGQIEIAGQPGNGTTVKLRLPCSKQADK